MTQEPEKTVEKITEDIAEINPEDFKLFSMISILVISFFSSLIVSIVEKGDIKAGVKYIPIYIFGAMALYTIFMKVLGAVFAGIIPSMATRGGAVHVATTKRVYKGTAYQTGV